MNCSAGVPTRAPRNFEYAGEDTRATTEIRVDGCFGSLLIRGPGRAETHRNNIKHAINRTQSRIASDRRWADPVYQQNHRPRLC